LGHEEGKLFWDFGEMAAFGFQKDTFGQPPA
jgi:hypothetical protein